MIFIRSLLFCWITAIASNALAQAPNQPIGETTLVVRPVRKTPVGRVNYLASKLALTSNQRKQILQILVEQDRQMDSIKNDSLLSEKELREKVLTVRRDSKAKIRSLLTDVQLTAYDEMQQEAVQRLKMKKLVSVPN